MSFLDVVSHRPLPKSAIAAAIAIATTTATAAASTTITALLLYCYYYYYYLLLLLLLPLLHAKTRHDSPIIIPKKHPKQRAVRSSNWRSHVK